MTVLAFASAFVAAEASLINSEATRAFASDIVCKIASIFAFVFASVVELVDDDAWVSEFGPFS